ncbi:hypothetical protein B0H13DRAFT_2418683 [Mycena leptocephala]|nr:hypothetical protein B0H13DRAFT_2418683 [Mycena leptocephala]
MQVGTDDDAWAPLHPVAIGTARVHCAATTTCRRRRGKRSDYPSLAPRPAPFSLVITSPDTFILRTFLPIPTIPHCTLFTVGALSSIAIYLASRGSILLFRSVLRSSAPRALPSLDADETKGWELRFELSRAATHDDTKGRELRFELSRASMHVDTKGLELRFELSRASTHDDTKGRELRFVLSRASTHDETKARRCRELRFELSRASTPTTEGPGAAIRALPRLDDTMAGRCASCSLVPRRYNGRETRLVLSRASTIQWPGDVPRALSRLDDTMAGRCASCSLAPRRYNGREPRLLQFVLSRASTLLARRDKGRDLGFVLSRAAMMHDLADDASIRRRIPLSSPPPNSTFLAKLVNAPVGSEANSNLQSHILLITPLRRAIYNFAFYLIPSTLPYRLLFLLCAAVPELSRILTPTSILTYAVASEHTVTCPGSSFSEYTPSHAASMIYTGLCL